MDCGSWSPAATLQEKKKLHKFVQQGIAPSQPFVGHGGKRYEIVRIKANKEGHYKFPNNNTYQPSEYDLSDGKKSATFLQWVPNSDLARAAKFIGLAKCLTCAKDQWGRSSTNQRYGGKLYVCPECDGIGYELWNIDSRRFGDWCDDAPATILQTEPLEVLYYPNTRDRTEYYKVTLDQYEAFEIGVSCQDSDGEWINKRLNTGHFQSVPGHVALSSVPVVPQDLRLLAVQHALQENVRIKFD